MLRTLLFDEYDIDGDTISFLEIQQQVKRAQDMLGENIVYDDTLLDELQLDEISEQQYEKNDKELETKTLQQILEEHIIPLRNKGHTSGHLRQTLKHVSNKHRVIDILKTGERKCLIEGFTPNAGAEVSMGGSYLKMRRICNHDFMKSLKKGLAVAFSENALRRTKQMSQVHVSKTVWAEKAGTIEGRTCLHGSS